MLRRAAGWLLPRVARAALDQARTTIPRLTTENYRQVFAVSLPLTVFIYAENSRITIQHNPAPQVTLDASLRASFGWQIVAEQDDAGVYIVAKRKPVVGGLAQAAFRVTLPVEAYLQLELTGGALLLEDLSGRLEIPAIRPIPARAIALPDRN
jgi:hypothetical protein